MANIEIVKDKIKAHPTETVAAVAVVTTLAVILYFKKKEKQTAVRIAHCKCPPTQGWWELFLDRTFNRKHALPH